MRPSGTPMPVTLSQPVLVPSAEGPVHKVPLSLAATAQSVPNEMAIAVL